MTQNASLPSPVSWPPTAQVSIQPFIRQSEAGSTVLSWPEIDVFLELPDEAVVLLDWLSSGQTIEQAQASYLQRYGEVPDLIDLLEQLQVEGLVQTGGQTLQSPAKELRLPLKQLYLPLTLSKILWSPRMLAVYAAVIIGAIFGAVSTPSAVPGWRSLIAEDHLTTLRLFLMCFGLVITATHEFAHASAARALGVPSRFSLGRRLWIWVAQTDMTGVWSVPRHQRYLPLLAGIICDLVCASIGQLVLVGDSRGLYVLPDLARLLIPAVTFSYVMALVPQLYFFVRTDLYYVFSTSLNCKNLMGDTETYLGQLWARWLRRPQATTAMSVPVRELAIVKRYAWVWVIGRVFAVLSLILVGLPVLWTYGLSIFTALGKGFSSSPYAFVDALGALLLFLVPQLLGVFAWSRQFSTEGKAYDAR